MAVKEETLEKEVLTETNQSDRSVGELSREIPVGMKWTLWWSDLGSEQIGRLLEFEQTEHGAVCRTLKRVAGDKDRSKQEVYWSSPPHFMIVNGKKVEVIVPGLSPGDRERELMILLDRQKSDEEKMEAALSFSSEVLKELRGPIQRRWEPWAEPAKRELSTRPGGKVKITSGDRRVSGAEIARVGALIDAVGNRQHQEKGDQFFRDTRQLLNRVTEVTQARKAVPLPS